MEKTLLLVITKRAANFQGGSPAHRKGADRREKGKGKMLLPKEKRRRAQEQYSPGKKSPLKKKRGNL